MAIPSSLRVPFISLEVSNAKAQQGPALLAYRALLLGQKTAAGTAAADSLHLVTSAAQVSALAGRGSMLHRQALSWFENNLSTELWIGVLADNGAGVAASGTLTVSGPATAAGTLAVYIVGERVEVAVANGDSANTIAAALNTAINANLDLPVTSTVLNAVVTVTVRHKGLVGNGVDMRANYREDDAYPAGVSVAVVAMSGGTTAPSLTAVVAALGDIWFHVWAHPWTDSTSLDAIEAEMASRFGPLRMIEGVVVTSAVGSTGTLSALGGGRNSPHSVIVAQDGDAHLTWSPEFAAAVAAVMAAEGAADPARPFQTLPLVGALPQAETDRFALQERNLLLFDGIATSSTDAAGQVRIERLITTYQTGAGGAADTSYLDAVTMLTLLYLRYSFRTQFANEFPRHKLANDGVRFAPGQPVMTPSLGKGWALNWFRQMEALGLVEGFEQFKRDLVVQRNQTDPNRLDFLLPVDVINQLRVVGATLQFLL